jgi:hypothetical protein
MQRRERKIRRSAYEGPVQRLAEIRKAPVLAGLARQNWTEFDPYDWVVDEIGIEPVTLPSASEQSALGVGNPSGNIVEITNVPEAG